eukprot:7566815-Pyramimonas_sp.AAC.1
MAFSGREDDWQKTSSDLSFVDDLTVPLQVDRTDEPPRKALHPAEIVYCAACRSGFTPVPSRP